MGSKDTLDSAIYFTKLSVRLAFSWPPGKNSTNWEKTKFDLLWFMSIVSAFGLLIPLLYSLYEYHADSFILTQSVCFVGAVTSFIVKCVICRIHRKRIQALIHEMEEFLRASSSQERSVLERYVKRCSFFHVTVTIINYLTTAFGICGPFLMPDDQRFPTTAVYPFSIDYGPLVFLVYVHQSFVGFQCSVGATVNCQAAFFIWYVGARFEILMAEFEKIHDTEGFFAIMKKHQRLLELAEEAKSTMTYIALTTTMMSGIATVFSSLQLISDQPFLVRIKYGPVAVISIACLFVCAWPADNLINVFLSAAYSYFTTARMVMNMQYA